MPDRDRDDPVPTGTPPPDNLDEELAGFLTARLEAQKTAEREGLPPGYRMRADAHYVDQLSVRAGDVPMRLVAVEDIDAPEFSSSGDPAGFRALVDSIVEHGVVQPLLVRRDGPRYRLIAGRKRFAAARAASIARIPCLVHNVDEVEAGALARAVDLHGGATSAPTPAAAVQPGGASLAAPLREAIATIQAATTLLADEASPTLRRVALDLVRAASWRASWQLRAAAVLDRTHQWQFRPHLVGPLLARVRDGFAADGRLQELEATLTISDWNIAADLDEDAFVAAVSGGIVATAALAAMGNPRVGVLVHRGDDDEVSVDITHDAAGADEGVARRFFDAAWKDRPGGPLAAIGAAVARAVAERHGGGAAMIIASGRSTLRLRFGLAALRRP